MATTFLTPYNNAETTVAVQLEIAGTSLTVADGSVFPASNFQISLFVTKGVWNPATDEIAYCTSRTDNVLTLTGGRAQESTSDLQHLVGAYVAMFPTAKYLSDIHTAVNNRSRSATLVVAASDAYAATIDAADSACSGAADQVEINAALSA